ncbi:MAG: hypothetical protein IKI84_02215, partial [Clostridia bacterium]|nr:hypothetical protein [Clostridia bacterium]
APGTENDMNYRELKKRIEEEDLGRYGGFGFDSLYGGENAWGFSQSPDRTVNIVYMGDRGSVITEKLGLPEEEGCEEIYRCVKREFALRESYEKLENRIWPSGRKTGTRVELS